MIRFLLVLILFVLPAKAENIVLGLSKDEVAITATFDGSSILIFGAIKREAPLPGGPPLDVVVTVTGPDKRIDVRRKSRVAGIWVNTASIRISQAPSFYAVATTGPLSEVVSETEDLRYRISIDRAIRTIGASDDVDDVDNFVDALVRLQEEEELYQILEGDVALDQQTLFRTSLDLPANLVEGDYRTRIFLFREGSVVDLYETEIEVRKVGLERWLYSLAHNQPLMYGFLSLFIAISAGWLASAAFRIFQR